MFPWWHRRRPVKILTRSTAIALMSLAVPFGIHVNTVGHVEFAANPARAANEDGGRGNRRGGGNNGLGNGGEESQNENTGQGNDPSNPGRGGGGDGGDGSGGGAGGGGSGGAARAAAAQGVAAPAVGLAAAPVAAVQAEADRAARPAAARPVRAAAVTRRVPAPARHLQSRLRFRTSRSHQCNSEVLSAAIRLRPALALVRVRKRTSYRGVGNEIDEADHSLDSLCRRKHDGAFGLIGQRGRGNRAVCTREAHEWHPCRGRDRRYRGRRGADPHLEERERPLLP